MRRALPHAELTTFKSAMPSENPPELQPTAIVRERQEISAPRDAFHIIRRRLHLSMRPLILVRGNMHDFASDATAFGSYYSNVGLNGTVIVNIGASFGGAITVDLRFFNEEIGMTCENIPTGWELRLGEIQEDINLAALPYLSLAYWFSHETGDPVGILGIRTSDTGGVPCLLMSA